MAWPVKMDIWDRQDRCRRTDKRPFWAAARVRRTSVFAKGENLGAGAALPPRALKSRRVKAASGGRNAKRETRLQSQYVFEGRSGCKRYFEILPGNPPYRPSGRRRFCAVRAFCRRQNLGAGGIHFRRALKYRRVEAASGGRNPKRKTSAFSRCLSFWYARRDSNPQHSEPESDALSN